MSNYTSVFVSFFSYHVSPSADTPLNCCPVGILPLKRRYNFQLGVQLWPVAELQSTRVTSDLDKQDPLMHDRLEVPYHRDDI